MVRRVLSILLCGCLLAGSLSVNGLAAEEQTVETAADNAGGGIATPLLSSRQMRK